MEEKERYSYDYFIDGAVFIDTENDRDMDMDTVCSLLNKQDKQIKELAKENEELKLQLETFAHRISDQNEEILELKQQLELTEKALELACKDVHDLTQNQIGIELCYECEHFDLCNKISNVDKLDLECEQVFAIAYKNKAEKEMMKSE